MELAAVDQHVDHIAGDRSQDLVGVDFGADDGSGGDKGGGRTGDDDVIAGFEDRIHLRLDIGSVADNSLDDGSSADLVLDRLDGSARGGRDPVGPRLEFAIMEILGLRRRATGEFSLELRGLLLQVDPHQLRSDERHEQQREDIAQHIGDGVAGGYVGLLLVAARPG